MSVSHELRTPLTAIRGHVAALSEGLVEDEAARAVSLEIVAEETERSRARSATCSTSQSSTRAASPVLQEEVDMEHLVERAYTTFHEEARRRGIDYRSELQAQPGAHHRRRPRPADHHEPAVERLPVDARTAAGSSSGLTQDNGRCRGLRRRHRPGDHARSASGSSGRSGRATARHRLGLAIANELAQRSVGASISRPRSARLDVRARAAELVTSPQPARVVELRPRAGRPGRVRRAAAAAVVEEPAALRGIIFAAQLGDARRWARALRSSSPTARPRAPRISSTTSATLPTTGCIP
jgi:hypothetical protein